MLLLQHTHTHTHTPQILPRPPCPTLLYLNIIIPPGHPIIIIMFVSTNPTPNPTPNSANNSNTNEEWNKQQQQQQQQPKRLRLRLLVIGSIVVALVVLQLVGGIQKLSSYTTTTSSSVVVAVPTVPTSTTRQTMMTRMPQQQEQQEQSNPNNNNNNNNNNNDNNDCPMSSSSYNSKEWLQGPRLGNIQMPDDDDNDDDDIMWPSSWMLDLVTPVADNKNHNTSNNKNKKDILTNNIQQLLKQTICHETSNFVDFLKDDVEQEEEEEQQQATIKDTDDIDDAEEEEEEEEEDDDPLLIQMWTIRFIYLAIYHHQHRHAIPEYHERKRKRQERTKENSCRTEDDGSVVGNFDYECKDAKLLVVPLSNHGLGSVLRLGATNAILTGLALNRTVLFVNGVDRPMPPGITNSTTYNPYDWELKPLGFHYILTKSWSLASCSRHDYQCFFQPITPCVISQQEYQSAPMIRHPNGRGPLHTLFNYDSTRKYANDRVVIVKLGDVKGHAWNQQSIVLQQLAREVLQSLVIDVNPKDPRIPLFQKAINAIQPDPYWKRAEEYPGSGSIIKRGILFYLMRPNPEQAQKLKHLMIPIQQEYYNNNDGKGEGGIEGSTTIATIPPPTTTTTTSSNRLTFGLPIRASDKCNTESECLTFSQYMKLLQETFQNGLLFNTQQKQQQQQQTQQQQQSMIINVLLTSESQSVFDEKDLFFQNFTRRRQALVLANHDIDDHLSSSSFLTNQIRFISNNNDVRQGSGAMFQHQTINRDDILLSAISSIQTQLLGSQFTIGNCCSNFHHLIFDLLRGGCGNARVMIEDEDDELVEESEEGNNNDGTTKTRKKKKKKRRRSLTTTQCLQDHPNPEFAICCYPRKTPVCPRERLKRLAEYQLNHSSSWSSV